MATVAVPNAVAEVEDVPAVAPAQEAANEILPVVEANVPAVQAIHEIVEGDLMVLGKQLMSNSN